MEIPTRHQVIIGDARRLAQTADESVHLVVTSPPYWQLKDYGAHGQIGFNDSYEDYINHLNLVWSECRRALAPGCRLCVNVGDQFARAAYYGRYKVIPIRTEITRFCETAGFDYMGTIIWQKALTMNASGGASIMGSYPYPRNGIVKLDYESILLFKKQGKAPPPAPDRKERSRLTREEWNRYFYGHWNFPGARQDKHLAMFPVELPRRLIKMFSFVGDTVLDPFLGSGTTCLAALELDRNSVGYEINEQFVDVIKEKLAPPQARLNSPDVEIIRRKAGARPPDFARLVRRLPYVFKDPVQMRRKADPGEKPFGPQRGAPGLHRVKEIRRADRLVLEDGRQIGLLGVRLLNEKTAAAAEFVSHKTRGKKVFVRFDQEQHDGDGNLLGYLYLADKTFINAHLIKRGLAVADRNIQHRHLGRFLRYQEEVKNG